ncbi:MAG TPA: tetratricopeptide repeat protein [Polyangiales bacterium]|nr:tetratricopeptide repeat protein [Polyangiales bacterium]
MATLRSHAQSTRHDCRGVPITTSSQLAVELFDCAVQGFVAHRKDTAQRLERALAEDPGLVPALCLRGFAYKALQSRQFEAEAGQCLAAAEVALAVRGGCARERLLVGALERWCAHAPLAAIELLDAILREHPRDLLSFKLQHAINFIHGRSSALRSSAERCLPSWDDSVPGHGYVLGCYAFSLEETGSLSSAERVGRRAIELQPDDAWGAHAVAHVLETQDRAREGLLFLDAAEPALANCNNFGGHIAWHRSLFHLQLEDHAAALTLHDESIAPHLGRDYRDVCNASSLLWRLEAAGVQVGERWRPLVELARAHQGDHRLAFADAHYVLSLAAAGELQEAAAFTASMQGGNAVMREIGAPLASGIVALCAGRAGLALERMLPIAARLSPLGGSNAQRDLFELMLIEAALRAERRDVSRALLERRLRARPDNRWARQRLQYQRSAA